MKNSGSPFPGTENVLKRIAYGGGSALCMGGEGYLAAKGVSGNRSSQYCSSSSG